MHLGLSSCWTGFVYVCCSLGLPLIPPIPCSHAIAACAFSNLNYDDFVVPVYKLENIFKVYQHHFHSLESEDTWPQYLGPYFMSDPSKRRQT